MTQIVAKAAALGRASGVTWDRVSGFRERTSDGARVVGLALIQAWPRAEDLAAVIDSIANARSPFEQYHALRAAEALLARLAPTARDQLAAAIRERMTATDGVVINTLDRGRARKAEALLAQLQLPPEPCRVFAAAVIARAPNALQLTLAA